jgi:hypothetical protein
LIVPFFFFFVFQTPGVRRRSSRKVPGLTAVWVERTAETDDGAARRRKRRPMPQEGV